MYLHPLFCLFERVLRQTLQVNQSAKRVLALTWCRVSRRDLHPCSVLKSVWCSRFDSFWSPDMLCCMPRPSGRHSHHRVHLIVSSNIFMQGPQHDHGYHSRQEQHDHQGVHDTGKKKADCLYTIFSLSEDSHVSLDWISLKTDAHRNNVQYKKSTGKMLLHNLHPHVLLFSFHVWKPNSHWQILYQHFIVTTEKVSAQACANVIPLTG